MCKPHKHGWSNKFKDRDQAERDRLDEEIEANHADRSLWLDDECAQGTCIECHGIPVVNDEVDEL